MADADVDIAADSEATLPILIEEVKRQLGADRRRALQERGKAIGDAHRQARVQAMETAAYGCDSSPISLARLSAELWAQIKDEDWSLVSWQGFVSGWPDNGLMRLMDVVLAFPSLLLAIAIVTAAGRSLFNALVAIAIVSIPVYARIARSAVLSTREQDFVTASRALGESSIGILTRRILPNSFTPLVVQGTLDIGTAVLGIAALAFIGVTGDLSNPEWGSMIGLEKDQLFNAPHIILAPGIAITITVLAFNLLGDGLRDALDPRLNR